MISGCYIGKKPEPDYGLVSTGDYINPIVETFRLKGSGETLQKVQTLYLIVNDIDIEFAKIKVVGRMTTIRLKLSKDGKEWNDEITFENISAYGTTVVKPFYVGFFVDDILEYYNLRNASSIKNYKLELIYN
jgi:hypothetical protein